MPFPAPVETVRLVLEARAAGDDRRLLALLAPDVVAETAEGRRILGGAEEVRALLGRERAGGTRTELDAQRFEADGEGVLVHGRVRVIERGRLSDSPASWRFTVVGGRVTCVRQTTAGPALPRVA